MDTIALAKEVEARYRGYIKTMFQFRDPDLRSSFNAALDAGHIAKGPYLQSTPVFKCGDSTRSLFAELLGKRPEESLIHALQGDRPLYRHQEIAIRKVSQGRNVVVSTGTGSGKTESFLLPIVLRLYQQHMQSLLGSGVRALVLYPMNALANDQRDRLAATPIREGARGGILYELDKFNSPFRFTIGQYIGDTPEDANDTRRNAREFLSRRTSGELVLREEMRQAPPNILLTNYSMLEYLLLRPEDSSLFDGGRGSTWKFLVLDEAHQYRGSKGIEMAMLIRRLKQRLRDGGCADSLQCIATSASLVGGESDRADVARFASDLFGEPFEADDVVLGEVEPIQILSDAIALQPNDYKLLQEFLNGITSLIDEILEIARRVRVNVEGITTPQAMVGAILAKDTRSTQLRLALAEQPRLPAELINEIFDDLSGISKLDLLTDLVNLQVQARLPGSDSPLLSARYHLFLRSLEGAYLQFLPKSSISLDRRSTSSGATGFELALCRQCGQHYVVGIIKDGKLIEGQRDPGSETFGVRFFLPIDRLEELDATSGIWQICATCGDASPTGQMIACNHQTIRLFKELDNADGKEDQVSRCIACQYQAQDPLRELMHGTDGPHAVITTSLYQHLPPDRNKILAFADGRQEAAFFAWYMENSYDELLSRNLILNTARGLSEAAQSGLTLREIAAALRESLRQYRLVKATAGDLDVLHDAWKRVLRELLTDEQRISLEGLGLIRWDIGMPQDLRIPECLQRSPWALDPEEAKNLVFLLLQTLRADRAIELLPDKHVHINFDDLMIVGKQSRVTIGSPQGEKDLKSWDTVRGRRAEILRKLLPTELSKSDADEAMQLALREIWDAIRESGQDLSAADRPLINVGGAVRINSSYFRLHAITKQDSIYQCDVCGRLQSTSIKSICFRSKCQGKVKSLIADQLNTNHYATLYASPLPPRLTVEEHTAQLDSESAKNFQRDFKEGKINVLSCSTTFELGVDLGDLDTVFLRNVPPESFNYDQRVGRSGRRAGRPGFAITFCKRGPHDMYHFAEPQRMLTGKVKPPVLTITNKKIIARHLVASALSAFFRAHSNRFKTVAELLVNIESPQALADVRAFVEQQRAELNRVYHEILPNIEPLMGVDANNVTWIGDLFGPSSRFALAEAEVSADYRSAREYERIASEQRDYKTAQWADLRARTIADEQALTFLSRKTVIPKYGFPVDVVELDTQRAGKSKAQSDVALSRDLSMAISEFAPTGQLIANKKLWTSHGLKKVVDKEWPRRKYRKCKEHNVFQQWTVGSPEPQPICNHPINPGDVGEYISPIFGFVTSREGPTEPSGRTARVFSTRPYFASEKLPDGGIINLPIDNPILSVKKTLPGLMVVLCEGRKKQGFYICTSCGTGVPGHLAKSKSKAEAGHKSHYGAVCKGTLTNVALGHEFETDVLRVQFKQQPPIGIEQFDFAYSLASALVEGAAEVLEVPAADVNVTVGGHSNEPLPLIILFDNVPGGAGLVSRLEHSQVLVECLRFALERVSGGCGCAPNTSCYGCLRSYRNQFAHNLLQRGPVGEYLQTVLSRLEATATALV